MRVVCLFFFFSGFSALIYEIAWVRELALTLGNTAAATSTVLAVFLGGLAVGAAVAGKLAKKHVHNALAVYGYLELAVGLIALFVSQLLKATGVIYVWLYHLPLAHENLLLVRLIIAAILLFPPTFFMGATLPVLIRYLEIARQPARLFSVLYGLNTLGAAAGSLAACFAGFTFIGIQATVYCAASINLSIALLAVYFSKSKVWKLQDDSAPQRIQQESEEILSSTESPSIATISLPPLSILCAISFLSGFTALSYEVLWTRILRSCLTSLTYAFTIMIGMFLLGLAAGSFLIDEGFLLKIKSFRERPYFSFAILQLLAAVAGAASLYLTKFSFAAYDPIKKIIFAPLGLTSYPLSSHLLFMLVVSTIAIFLPAILIGMLFPLIGTLAASRTDNSSSSVGFVYAVNTIGCVFGSIICGMLLMPTVGSYNSIMWIVRLSALTGIIACFYAERIPRPIKALLMTCALGLAIAFSPIQSLIAFRPGAVLLAKGEDTTGIMQVVSIPKDDDVQLIMNGGCLAGSSPIQRRYMRLMGHLPALLSRDPENVLVGCFGTGTTCAAVVSHPEVKHVDLVELSPMVLGVAHCFSSSNNDVLHDPKLSVLINDVRNFLLSSNTKYDVVTFEPPPPTEAGVVNLYSREFYQLVSDKLKDDGIVCQWVPMHQVSDKLFKMQLATAREIFPYVSLWLPNNQEAIFVASKQPLNINITDIDKRINASDKVKANMHEVGLDSPELLLSTYVMSGKTLDKFISESLPITDDLPRLEFFLPYYGPLTQELDVEGIGKNDLLHFAAICTQSPHFKNEEFWKAWQTIHLLRELENSHSKADADRLIDAAVSILPKSPWLQYANSHRSCFYKKPGFDTWIHGP